VCVGRFSQNKNQVALVEALRQLDAKGAKVECRFIGDGSEAGTVKAAAAGLDAVTFVSHANRSQIFEAMGWADLNVLPSFREGYPKVLVEGMSAGALPVASDTAMNQSITEGRGWVFDPREPEHLARTLENAMVISLEEWQSRRRACAAYAQRHTLDAFSAEIDYIVNGMWKIGRIEEVQGR
jgi:glycosyltransferase involved in cell wall biosynthesis